MIFTTSITDYTYFEDWLFLIFNIVCAVEVCMNHTQHENRPNRILHLPRFPLHALEFSLGLQKLIYYLFSTPLHFTFHLIILFIMFRCRETPFYIRINVLLNYIQSSGGREDTIAKTKHLM